MFPKVPIHLIVAVIGLWLLIGCKAQRAEPLTAAPETPVGHPIQLPPPSVPDDPDYDPHLLVPQYNREIKRWGYVDRTTRKLVIEHKFFTAGRIQRGVAYATTMNQAHDTEDVYRITPDGKHTRIFAGNPKWRGKGVWGKYFYNRTPDDHYYINQGDRHRLLAPDGRVLWDTIAPYQHFRVGGTTPAYLGEGNLLMVEGDQYVIRDTNLNAVARLDTSAYAVIMGNFHDWVRTKHTIPPIMVMDRTTKKVGWMNHRGKLVIPIEWDMPNPESFRNVRAGMFLVDSWRNVPNQFGHIATFRNGRHYLIDTTGRIVYRVPDSAYIAIDPHFGYNVTENMLLLETRRNDASRSTNAFVVDLDDQSVPIYGGNITQLSDDLYASAANLGTPGYKRTPIRTFSASGKSVSTELSNLPYGASIYLSRQGQPCKTFLVGAGDEWTMINSEGRLLDSLRNMAGYFNATNREFYYVFTSMKKPDGSEYRLFLEDGTQVAGPLANLEGMAESRDNGGTYGHNNLDWRSETEANMLVYLDLKAEPNTPRWRGYVDRFGHCFFLECDSQ